GKRANLFSELLLHSMGRKLADNILQGDARGDEFRTAPLWGLGQRIFFLHDGRTSDLLEAIQAHVSRGNREFDPSEANRVIAIFNALGEAQKQDILNFLRGLCAGREKVGAVACKRRAREVSRRRGLSLSGGGPRRA